MISVENSHLSFEALLVITNSSSPPLTATNYKPCFKVILGETEITNRLGSVLCHTSMKQTWQSTHTQYWKTNLKEHSAILVQNRLVKSMDLESWRDTIINCIRTYDLRFNKKIDES